MPSRGPAESSASTGALIEMREAEEKLAPATEAMAATIAQYLRAVAALMAVKSDAEAVRPPLDEVGIIARLDLILAKLDHPVVPLSAQLWDTAHIGAYLKRSTDNVRKQIICLPSFPEPIRLPVHGKAQALYKAREVIQWAESLQARRRK